MPNWCGCSLKITGPKKALDAFKATLNTPNSHGEKVPFAFHQTVPFPANGFQGDLSDKDRAECAAKGIPNWYDWNTANWGTKWDASDPDVEINPKSIKITFQTAWSPPLEWLEKASKAHPELTFEMGYSEYGMNFYGEATAINGELSDSCQDYPKNSFDDDGNPKGVAKKHLEKWGCSQGG